MKRLPILFAALLMVWMGCSCKSTIERANLVDADARRQYVKSHPDGAFNEFIREGEITRGMSVHEVIASWGMPNVYVITKTTPAEQWIYYIKDQESLSMLIYTLTFEDDTLRIWDIDQKRFTSQGIAAGHEAQLESPSQPVDPRRKR